MTLSTKRREVKEPAPKLKVLTRSVADKSTPPALTGTTTPAGIAAHDPSASGASTNVSLLGAGDEFAGLAYSIKLTALEKFLREYTFIELGLPEDDIAAATKQVKARVWGLKHDQEALHLQGAEDGLQFYQHSGGALLTTWPYDVMTDAILQRSRRLAEKGKSSGRAKKSKAPVAPPIVPPAALAPTARELMKTVSTGEMLDVKKLKRHPLNRQPSDADVKARAESLQADGQLEDIVVRMTEGGWQIVSGETRCLAAKQLGWTQLRCTVIDCDDNEALRLVGLFNGQRSNLTPIQKAQHIKLMCAQGMTREDAARSVGLESHSAASNLVKLLELPQAWQDRVASGELAETFARSIAAYANVPGLLAELDEIWINGDDWERKDTFGSRDELDESIQQILRKVTRPMKGERYYDWGFFEGMGTTRPTGNYKVLITPAELEAHREQLGIVSIAMKEKQHKSGGKFTWKSADVEVATNAALFDKLQVAHIIELSKKNAKGKAQAAGASADAGEMSKGQTAAEKKLAAEERARQLDRSIEEWRETVQRREIAAAMRAFKPTAKIDPRLLRLVLCFVTDELRGDVDIDRELQQGLEVKKYDPRADPYDVVNKALADGDPIKWQKAVLHIAAFLIGGDADDPRPLEFCEDVLQSFFDAWGCDMGKAWEKLCREGDPLVEEFLRFHRKEELATLAWEIAGSKFNNLATKDGMVSLLLKNKQPLQLPKSLQPATKGKRGAK